CGRLVERLAVAADDRLGSGVPPRDGDGALVDRHEPALGAVLVRDLEAGSADGVPEHRVVLALRESLEEGRGPARAHPTPGDASQGDGVRRPPDGMTRSAADEVAPDFGPGPLRNVAAPEPRRELERQEV